MKRFYQILFFALLTFFISSQINSPIFANEADQGNLQATVTQSRPQVTCKLVEIGPRYSGNVVSSKNTQINPSQNLGLVASIVNDDGNHTSIQWTSTGGYIHNTSWDLTEWQAPSTPGTYVLKLSIYNASQPSCTSTFTVVPNADINPPTQIYPITAQPIYPPIYRITGTPIRSNSNVTCQHVEINPRYSGNIVSNSTTQVSAAENLALVAQILNDDGNHTSIIWNTSGGYVHNTSWDLTEWRAPTTPGTYSVELSIYGVPQPDCTSTFVVLPNTSAVSCSKLESYSRYSGNILSNATTVVSPLQRIPVIASILNDDGNHTSITWSKTGGKLENYYWDIIDWVAPKTPGSYKLTMSIYGTKQPACTATFLVNQTLTTTTTSSQPYETIQSNATEVVSGKTLIAPFAQVQVVNETTKQTYKTQAGINGNYAINVKKHSPNDVIKITTQPQSNILTRIIQFFMGNPKAQPSIPETTTPVSPTITSTIIEPSITPSPALLQ